MDFFSALRAAMNGSAIARELWGDEDTYCDLLDGMLTIHNEDGDHNWIISLEDMMAIDWYIVEETDLALV